MIEELDTADDELRAVICNIWPALAKKQMKLHEGGTKSLLDLVVPPKTGAFFLLDRLRKTFVAELHGATAQPKLTVGKLYAMALYIDNYRSFKQGHSNDTGVRTSVISRASQPSFLTDLRSDAKTSVQLRTSRFVPSE